MQQETRKAAYYPVSLTIGETRFGLTKLLEPSNPYDSPLPGNRRSIKVDVLEVFRDYWGSNILLSRDNIYKLISGDFVDDDEWRALMSTYYKTHAAFGNFVNNIYFLESRTVPFEKRFVSKVVNIYKEQSYNIHSYMKNFLGVKFLLEDKGYIYYKIPTVFSIEDLRGAIEV